MRNVASVCFSYLCATNKENNMRMLVMILFLGVVIAAQAYVTLRIWQYLPFGTAGKTVCAALYNVTLVCMLLFAGMMRSGQIVNFAFSQVVYEIATSWVFVLLYLVMIFGAIDLLRLCHVLPDDFTHESWAGTLTVAGIMLVAFVGGNIHYHDKYRQVLDLKTDVELQRPVKLVMMSDLHLGYHNRAGEFQRWIDLINAENADAVLIAGDIIDFSVVPINQQQMAQMFHQIKAPVYACLGNHEYIGNEAASLRFYQEAGINLLRDQTSVLPGTNVMVAGRDDRTNQRRASVSEILSARDKGQYVILLDHQPFHLEEAEQAGVNFQFSGHTHYGQVWPITHIIDAMYEDGFGPYQRGETRYYVSSGLGIWGGKFRIGTRSEYVVAEVHN